MEEIKNKFSFFGRASRTNYWLITVGGPLLLIAIDAITRPMFDRMGSSPIKGIIIISVLIPIFWLIIAVQVRRWHDLGRSGFYFLINLIPYLGLLVTTIILGFFSGTEEANEYGEKPKW